MTSKAHKKPKSDFYHPLTLAVCGMQNAGKTHLICRLIESLKSEFQIGYLKQAEHALDTLHKDTFRGTQAGARTVLFSHAEQSFRIDAEALDLLQQRQIFQSCDFVLVEGAKASHWPKWVVLDAEGEILKRVNSGEISNIQAFLYADQAPEDLSTPAFQRDDLQAIAEFLKHWLGAQIQNRPFYGLVLAGGMSQRMGQDKAALVYQDKTQLETSTALLAPLCQQVFVSARAEQKQSLQALTAFPVLEDRLLGLGPLGGILTAFLHQPEAAWLVLAVDLPWLDAETLRFLIQNRNPFALATAFRSSRDGLPEPLCAIYEPRFKERLFGFLGAGYQCPRKALLNSPIQYLELPEPHRLANANTPQDYEAIRREMADGNRSGAFLTGREV